MAQVEVYEIIHLSVDSLVAAVALVAVGTLEFS